MRSPSLIRDVPYPAIDGIRFYAALVVLIQHTLGAAMSEYFRVPAADFTGTSPDPWLRFLAYVADGNHGVDVFFLLSGFLMARIVLRSQRFSYGHFIASRFWRIYPAFLVSLVLVAWMDVSVFGWTWSASEFGKNLLFLNAVPGWVQIPYNHVSWSLGYEFAFYLVIPVFLLFTRFLDGRIVAAAAALACALLIPDGFIRMLGLFAGACLGSFSDETLATAAKRIPLIPTLGAFLAWNATKAFLGLTFLQYYYPLVILSALLIVKVVWDRDHLLNRFFALSWMRWLGTLSFSIYLYHNAVGALVLYKLTPQPASWGGVAFLLIATFVATIAVSWVSYVLIEQRYFRNRAHRAQAATATP